MYDYSKLKGLIKEHFGTQEEFCKAVPMSVTALISRFNGETLFRQDQMEKIIKITTKNMADLDQIFFTHE